MSRIKKNPWTWVPSLYFAEGLPNVIVVYVAVIMYKRLGLSNTDIAIYTSWLYLPWVIKPFWSPFVDIIKTKRWWITIMQLLIGAALGGVAFTIPTSFWLQGSLFFFWLMAFSSATHDIAADGFYMLGLRDDQQAFFVGIRSTFYRLAVLFGQGMLVMVAGNLEVYTRNIRYSWSLTFYLSAGLFIALWLYHNWILPKPKTDYDVKLTASEISHGFFDAFRTFFQKRDIITGLLFMLLYRAPEGMLSKICPLFLLDGRAQGGLGLSTQEISLATGTVGVIGLTLGGIIGGIAASRWGLKRCLWPMVCAITLPDLVYVYLSQVQPEGLLTASICIFFEQFGYGLGFTAYMLYLIYFSQGEHKTAHYAICTAFMALSLMLPGMFSGWLQESVGHSTFFIIVSVSCTMTFIVSALVRIDPEFGKKEKQGAS